ncbi:MAG: response regulator [Treponema sp.]|nr:response regulator [Treponema sp.]MCR5621355.1 response regulator [Treponema sp.]
MGDDSIEASSRFLASTLHEVRTPIQTIISTTELLDDTALDKEQTEYVRQIEFSANVLLQLANDVLDFTKIRSKEFKLESIPFDITELTEHVVDLISIDAFSKGLEVITDIDYSMQRNIMGDPTRVQQILLNLVKNAVKFTAKGYIYVKLSIQNNNLFFQVVDSGIGVSTKNQKLIFKDFFQEDASITRKYGGTGLGLTISKNLVEVMGGKIGIRSNPSGGSNFWFSLPLVKADFDLEKTVPDFIPKDARILIADPNRMAASSFVKKLRSLGIMNIDTAENGQEVLNKLTNSSEAKHPFDMAFINMLMPRIDGWSIASTIRKSTAITPLRLYLTVAEGQMGKDAKMKMLDLFDGYIYKPIKRERLLAIFNRTEYTAGEIERNERKKAARATEAVIAKGLSILVAEDHPVNRKLLHTFLEKYGANVFLAENGQQAVERIASNPQIDIIFMDIFMPVKSGIDATKEIRSGGYKGIIIACTANDDPDDIKEYTTMGINDILIKPYKRDSVKQMLEKWNTVLLIPEAKDIVSLAEMNNVASEIWDIADFMNTAGGDPELALSIMQEYEDQSQKLLEKLKKELAEPEKNFSQLRFDSHTLKGSSAAVSAYKLRDTAKDMERAAMAKDLKTFDDRRTAFALDFIKLKSLIKNWKSSL